MTSPRDPVEVTPAVLTEVRCRSRPRQGLTRSRGGAGRDRVHARSGAARR